MSKLNDLGFFNIQFDTKAVDENGNRRRTSFNNLHLNINGKSLFASAENGSGKTSIFRLFKSQFVSMNRAASDNDSASILNYFKYTQGSYPAIVWSDFISNEDSNKHTMIITYNQLNAAVNPNNLEAAEPDKDLDRYGIVINYNVKDNPAPTQDSFGIIPKLGLVKRDASGAYIPCAIKDIKRNLSENASNLKNFNPQIDICFAKSITGYSNVSEFHDAMLTQAYAPNDARTWKSIYSQILNSEGGIINVFFDTKSDNSTKIKKASEIISDLYFPTIIVQSGNEKNFDEMKSAIRSTFMARIEHAESYKKLSSYQTIQGKLEQLDIDDYQEKAEQYQHDKNREYQLKAKLLFTRDLLESEHTSYKEQLSQIKNKLLHAKYASYFLTKRDEQLAYDESKAETINAAKLALQNRDRWFALKSKENKEKLNDANGRLANAEQEKQDLEKRNSESEAQQTIKLLKAKLRKYYSDSRTELLSKLARQDKEEQRLKNERDKVEGLRKDQINQKAQLYSQKDSLQNEVDSLTSQTQDYTDQSLSKQKEETQTSIKTLTQTIAKLEETISDNKVKIEQFNKEVNEKNDRKNVLSREEVNKKRNFKEVTEKREVVLQILEDYRDFLKLPDTASKDEIINRFGLSLDKIQTSQREYLSRELSLNKQINSLKNKMIIDIPEAVKKFIEENDIETTPGFEYLSNLEPQVAKNYVTKYPYLPYVLLVNSEGFEKLSEFKESTGIESLLVVNKDKLAEFKTDNIKLIANFDFGYIDNYEDKVNDLDNSRKEIKAKENDLNREYNNLTKAKEQISSNYVSEVEVNEAQKALVKISEELTQVTADINRINALILQLTADNEDLSQQIREDEANLQEAKNKLDNLEVISQKLQELLIKKPQLELIKQECIKIDDELEKISQNLSNIINSIGELGIDKSKTKDQLNDVDSKLSTYRDADLALVSDQDMTNFSAQATKNELDRLINKQTSDLQVIEANIKHANEDIERLNKEREEFKKEYQTDTKDYREYVDGDTHLKKDLDLYSLDTLRNKFSALNNDFIQAKSETKFKRQGLQAAQDKLNKFLNENHEINTTLEITDLYQSVAQARESIRSLNHRIEELESNCIENEKLQGDVQSTIKHTIGSDGSMFNILKDQYYSQKELISDNSKLVEALTEEVEGLSSKNDQDKVEIHESALEAWKTLNLDKEDFGEVPHIKDDKIKKSLTKDSKNFNNVNFIAKGQVIKSIFVKVVTELKNKVEAEIALSEKAHPALKASQKTTVALILSMAHALQNGINEISKNSSVKLDRFKKAGKLVKIMMPNDVPDLEDQETKTRKHKEVKEELDHLYDRFEEIVNRKRLKMTDSKDKSEAKRLLRQFINKEINYTTLYRWGYGNTLDNINFKVINPYSKTKAQYLKWEGNSGDIVGSASGAQRLTISLSMLIPILRYLSADRAYSDSATSDGQMELFTTSKNNKGIYLPVDNFTANATKEELLAGVLEFAEKADIQIVSLNQVSATNISDDFHDTMSLSNDLESRIALIDLKLISAPDNNIDFLTMNFVDKKVD